MLKKPASGVLGPLSRSRTFLYAPPAKMPAALLDGLFEHPARHLRINLTFGLPFIIDAEKSNNLLKLKLC